MRATRTRESIMQHSVNIHASLKHDRWPGDRGRVMQYLRHNTLRPWSFRPASLSILRAPLKDPVMVDELAAKTSVWMSCSKFGGRASSEFDGMPVASIDPL